jgi:coenzyme F420-reducing hydrogenase delta subunit
MPFRRASELFAGIDLPDMPVAALREKIQKACGTMKGDNRVLVIGCDHGVPLSGLNSETVQTVSLRCTGQLPPSFIDYVLSKKLADGVVLTGCAENSCHARFGTQWTDARIARERDPRLRARVPYERLRILWAGRTGYGKLRDLVDRFAGELGALPSDRPAVHKQSEREEIPENVDG